MRPTQPLAWLFVCRTLLKLAIVLAAASWTMGCVPMRYTSGPATKGRVVDASTQAPIKGAFVTLTRAEGNAAQTSTSKDGEFHIRSKHSWYMLNLFHPSIRSRFYNRRCSPSTAVATRVLPPTPRPARPC